MKAPTPAALYDSTPAGNSELIDIELLVEHPQNPKSHPPEQIAQLQESLLTFDQTLPILVDVQNTILAGHGIYVAARANELTHVWIVRAAGWSNEKKEAYLIADNKLAEQSKWDRDMLSGLFTGFQQLDNAADLLDATGFSPIEINAVLNPGDAASGIKPVKSKSVTDENNVQFKIVMKATDRDEVMAAINAEKKRTGQGGPKSLLAIIKRGMQAVPTE